MQPSAVVAIAKKQGNLTRCSIHSFGMSTEEKDRIMQQLQCVCSHLNGRMEELIL